MKLSEFIAGDVAARLAAGGAGLPPRLTLESLAAHYGVSPMPVRTAVGRLVEQGVLVKEGNGRLSVGNPAAAAGPAVPGRAPAPPPANAADREAEIAADVLRISLGGCETFLREEAAADRYGMGRTVVRHVFGRLAGRGILEHVPRRGWLVRPFRGEDMRAFLEIRETLELKALDLARDRLVPEELRRMLAGNRPGGADGAPRLDNDLHRYLIEKAGNRYLADFFDRHGSYYAALFDYAALGASVVAEMSAQHRRILRALLARDWPAARRALSQHIRAQEPVLQKMLARLRGGG
jgi:DNA-binding GntR family transcriptional regulator